MTRIPLYLMALIIAIAKTPLDIFQVCAWNVGTLKVESWRSKRPAATVVALMRSLGSRLKDWFHASGGLPAVAVAAVCVALVIATTVTHPGMLAAAPVLAGLKGYRQRAADLKAKSRRPRRRGPRSARPRSRNHAR
jgi:hypothetical protein